MNRREFLRTAGGAAGGTAAVATATGTAVAAEAGGEIDYGGWLDSTDNFDGTVDATGQDEVTIVVGAEGNNGNFAFDPPGVQVDPGTTVIWEWNGEGGEHNVVAEEGADFESELTAEAGFTFEQTFEEDALIKYYCNPHRDLGMVGAVVVGSGGGGGGDGGDGGGGGGPVDLPDSAKTLGVASAFVMAATLGLAYFFLKYGGDYGDTS